MKALNFKNRRRGGITVFSLLFFIFFIFGAGVVFWPGLNQETTDIDVLQGETAGIIANHLHEKGLVNNVIFFKFWVKVLKVENKIAIGRYRLKKGQSSFWLVQKLINGDTFKVRVVIPEGFASWQIAERLDSLNVTKGPEFLRWVKNNNLEGYLFPATYDLDIGLSASAVASIFTQEFDRRWGQEFAQRAAFLGLNQKEVIILASIVEREVKMRNELPFIAALYLNRFKKGMKLEADPTVQYALGEWKTRLTYDDYKNTKSPYNTYLKTGLPPGPICNPGLDAVKAVLWPAPSKALFMVAKEEGYHDFSLTYREHVNKVNQRNRRWRIQKKGGRS